MAWRLKLGSPVILLTNLSPATGLANGTRLICKRFTTHVLEAEIATGHLSGKRVFIPRISRNSNEHDLLMPVHFSRRQLPLRMAFAMTINRSQGQTLSRVGLYLPAPVFAHGMLYTGTSRTPMGEDTIVMIKIGRLEGRQGLYTRDVVYREVLTG